MIANDDVYADRAVAAGQITSDEKDEFKRGVRRKLELEDKRGRGILTEAEAREGDALDRSRVGKAVDAATAESHVGRTVERDIKASASDANVRLRRDGAAQPVDESVFQDYAAGLKRPVASGEQPEVAARIKATGVNL